MAVTPTLGNNVPGGDISDAQDFFTVRGTIAFSGTYPGSGGDVLSFAGFPVPKITPLYVWIGGINGYGYGWNKSTGKVKVTTTSNTELANAAYPAGVTGDYITFEAIFPKA